MTLLGDIWNYREELRKSARSVKSKGKRQDGGREASMIVGSGALKHCRAGVYADWEAILRCTANHLQVDFEPMAAATHPTVAWEIMIRRAATDSKKPAYLCERRARRFVSNLIRECEQQIERRLGAADATDLSTFVERRRPRSIITLNFTPIPFCPSQTSPTIQGGIAEYRDHDRSIWCLHGCHADPDSLRLGVVRYSALLRLLAEGRDKYQERRNGGPHLDSSTDGAESLHRLIADIFESPLLIVGCGLRHAEWTIWWLLASKARNEARRNPCPSAFITADNVDEAQRLTLEGLNCKVIRVRSHSDVWSVLEFLMER